MVLCAELSPENHFGRCCKPVRLDLGEPREGNLPGHPTALRDRGSPSSVRRRLRPFLMPIAIAHALYGDATWQSRGQVLLGTNLVCS